MSLELLNSHGVWLTPDGFDVEYVVRQCSRNDLLPIKQFKWMKTVWDLLMAGF